MRYWVLDLIIVKRSVHVNRMIVGKYSKSVKKEQHEKCDNSCVQGIRDELKKLINRTVQINTEGRTYVGTVSSVSCDVVKLAAIPGSVGVIISICKIEAIFPPVTTVTAEFDFNGVDVANKA